MSRKRRYTVREWGAASGASAADLGEVEKHLAKAQEELMKAGQVMCERPGFLSADVDRVLRLKRDLVNLLFHVRALPPAFPTVDTASYEGGKNEY